MLIINTEKNISIMKINNIIFVLCTRIILSSFVIYIFCICHSGGFPIVYVKFNVVIEFWGMITLGPTSVGISLNLARSKIACSYMFTAVIKDLEKN